MSFKIDPNNLQNMVQRKVFEDPSGGLINLRIMFALIHMSHQSDLDDNKKSEVFDLILITALKLTAVWQHLDRYSKLEDQLIKEAYEKPIDETENKFLNKPVRLETAQNLYLELDGLLVQFKSTLDHMVHILHFTFGLPFEALTTFGDNGNKIKTQLTRNVPGKWQQPTKQISNYIDQNQEWLKQVIDLRDKMNHYKSGGIRLDNFTVFVRKIDGKAVLYVPQIAKNQTVREMMKNLLDSLITFVEHFIAFSMMPKLSKFGLYYKIKDDPNAARWDLVPIDQLRQYENDPSTKIMGET